MAIIDNNISKKQTFSHLGLPQGNIRGSTSFKIYLNKLCNIKISNCKKIISYADDTALLINGTTWADTKVHT